MNLLIVDDHISLLEGIEDFLSQKLDDTHVIYSCIDGKLAYQYFNSSRKIDLLITDLNLPSLNGFELIEKARQINPSLKTIVFTAYYNTSILQKLKQLGVNGFLPKNASRDKLILAIKTIDKGNKYFDYESIKTVKEHHFNNEFIDSFNIHYSLSKREMEVMNYIVSNLPNKEIAKKLNIGLETIKTYRKNIYYKTGVNNVLDLYKLLKSQ